jgi:hypothetical protein
MAKYKGNARQGGGNQGMGGYRGGQRKQGCCSYEEAGRALLRGKGGLALRYVRMDVKARMGLLS